jgi:flagellar biosynthesis regulator FlaF
MQGGYAAYTKVHSNNEAHRDLEYKVLGTVTGALINANKDEAVLPDIYNAALWNEKVWDAFRADLSSAENKLPGDLKDALISLSIWVGKETRRVLDNATGLDGLININRQIMAGLSSRFEAN